jgi:hypothetical protein
MNRLLIAKSTYIIQIKNVALFLLLLLLLFFFIACRRATRLVDDKGIP